MNKPKNTICLWYDKDALAAGGPGAKRAFAAMMDMGKIDVATIQAAVRGKKKG